MMVDSASRAYYALLEYTNTVVKVIYPTGYEFVGKLIAVVFCSGVLSLTISPIDYFGSVTVNNNEFKNVVVEDIIIKGVD